MSTDARFVAAEQLANQVADVIGGHSLDIAGSALALALAGVIAGYPPRERDLVERQVTTMLHMRVDQLNTAGLAAMRQRH